MFEEVNLIEDELLNINSSWCETVHSNVKVSKCLFKIVKGEDKGHSYLAERMELFRQKRATLFSLHVKFRNTMNGLAEKDKNLKRDASNFFKAVFGIPSSNDYKNLVNNLNLLRNSQNNLVNDTRKLATSMNLTQTVLKKRRKELDDLHTSLERLNARLSAINEE